MFIIVENAALFVLLAEASKTKCSIVNMYAYLFLSLLPRRRKTLSVISVCVLVVATRSDKGVKANYNSDITLELDTGETTENEGQGRRRNMPAVNIVL